MSGPSSPNVRRMFVLGGTDIPLSADHPDSQANRLVAQVQAALAGSSDSTLSALYFAPQSDASQEEKILKRKQLQLGGFQVQEFKARGIPIPDVLTRHDPSSESASTFPRIPYLLLHQYLDMDLICRRASLLVHQRDRTHTVVHANTAGFFGINLRRIAVRRSFPFVASHHSAVYQAIESAALSLAESMRTHSLPTDQIFSRDVVRDLFPFLADEPQLLGPLGEMFEDARLVGKHLHRRHSPFTRNLGRAYFWLGQKLNPYVYDKVEGGKAVMRIYQNSGELRQSLNERYGGGDSSLPGNVDPAVQRSVRVIVERYLQWFYRPCQLVLIDDEADRETLVRIGVDADKITRVEADDSAEITKTLYEHYLRADDLRGEVTAQIPHVQSLRDFNWKSQPTDSPSFKPFCTISDLHLADGDSFERMEALAELYPLLDAKGVNSIVYNGDLGELSASRSKYQAHRNRVNWVRQSCLDGVPASSIPKTADAVVNIASFENLKGAQREKAIRQLVKAAGRAGLRLEVNGKNLGILTQRDDPTQSNGAASSAARIQMDEVLTYGNHDEGLDLGQEFPGIRPTNSLVYFDPEAGAAFTHGHIVGLSPFLSAMEDNEDSAEVVDALTKSNLHEALEVQEVIHDLATLGWRFTERAINSRWLWKHALQPTVSRSVQRLRRQRLDAQTDADSLDEKSNEKARFWESLISPADDVERCGMLAAAFDSPDTPSWVCCYGHSHVPAIKKVRFQHPRTGRGLTKMVVNSGKFHGELITATIINFPEITIFYWSERDKEWRMHMYECLSEEEVAEVLGNDDSVARPVKPKLAAPISSPPPVTSGLVMHEVPTEGDGHITRFASLYPEYKKRGAVCTVLSGPRSKKLDLPGGVHHRCSGLRLHYNDLGGLDAVASTGAYFRQIRRVGREARELAGLIPAFQAIVSDFGPTLKLAHNEARRRAKARGTLHSLPELFGVSHQAALESHQENVPRPDTSISYDVQQKTIDMFRGTQSIGFHYERYNDSILLPMIRPEIRSMTPQFDGDFILVYVRGEPEMVVEQLSQVDLPIQWRVYHRSASEVEKKADNVWLHPTSRRKFTDDLGHCRGIFADAGFGITTESLHLGLPLVCRPVPNHLEQQANAAALRCVSNVGVVENIKSAAAVDVLTQTFGATLTNRERLDRSGKIGPIKRYPDVAKEVIERVFGQLNHASPLVDGVSLPDGGQPLDKSR